MPGGSEGCLEAPVGFVATGVRFCRGLGTRMAALTSAAAHPGLQWSSDGDSYGTLHGARLAAAKKGGKLPPSPSVPEPQQKRPWHGAKTAPHCAPRSG